MARLLNITVAVPGGDSDIPARHLAHRLVESSDYSDMVLGSASWADSDDHASEGDGPQPPDEPESEDPAQPDREIEAMAKIVRILVTMDPSQSAGVARYIYDRFTMGDLRS
jgi:hypothetical protein